MQRAAPFSISSSREKSAAKTRRARKTPNRCFFVGVLDSLQTAFNKQLVEFASIDDVCCFFASPFTSQPDVWHKLSQTFGVDEAALQQDYIDFKIVPGLKEQFLAAKHDLVIFWANKTPVRFLALREAAQKFLVLFGSTWSCESGFSMINHIMNSLRCRLTDKRLDELLRLAISPLAPGFSR